MRVFFLTRGDQNINGETVFVLSVHVIKLRVRRRSVGLTVGLYSVLKMLCKNLCVIESFPTAPGPNRPTSGTLLGSGSGGSIDNRLDETDCTNRRADRWTDFD